MSLKKIVSLLLTTLLLGICALAEGEITVTDLMGDSVTLREPAKSIVVLTAGECEILYAIGAHEVIVGRGEYCDYPSEVLEIPSVQSGFETNLEQILALQPDVVVCSTMNQSLEQINAMKAAGIAVVQSETTTLAGVYQTIEMLGLLTGHNDEAKALCESMQNSFAALCEKAAQNKPRSVYYEVSPLDWGLWAAGSDTFLQEIGEIVGLENIFGELSGWAEVSQEQIIERNPALIVTTMSEMMTGYDPVAEIIGRAGWQTISAVQENMVYMADSDSFTRPGPRLVDAAQALYDFVYGTEVSE